MQPPPNPRLYRPSMHRWLRRWFGIGASSTAALLIGSCGSGGDGDPGYGLTLSPSSIAAAPGDSVELEVTVQPTGGFSGAVDLDLLGEPGGIGGAFAGIGAGRHRLTVSIASTVAPGFYPVTVRGQSEGEAITRSTNLSVNVLGSGSGVGVSVPPRLSLRPGASVAVSASIVREAGVTGEVFLSLLLAPPGITANFQSNPCGAASTSMTLEAAAGVTPRVYDLLVVGSRGISSGTDSLQLEVVDVAAAPDLYLARFEFGQTVLKDGLGLVLVPGKKALLRAHVLADAPGVPSPRVTVTAQVDGSEVGSADLGGPAEVPTSEQPGSLAAGFSIVLPPEWIVPGLQLRLEIDPDDSVLERDEDNNASTFAPSIGTGTVLDLVMVPVVLSTGTGTVPDFASTLERVWPLSGVSWRTRAPFTPSGVTAVQSDGTGWETVLSELATLRIADGEDAYYYGLIRPGYGSGVAGLGYVGGRSSVGMDSQLSVMAHELGHNFGLLHAPCGTGGAAGYPYPNGQVGSWGFDQATETLVPPDRRDLMSYCYPVWISDYFYERAQKHLETAPIMLAAGMVQPLVLVSGQIEGHVATLRPVQRFDARARPPSGGSYWLRLECPAGVIEYPFEPESVGCGPESSVARRHFAFTVADPGPIGSIEVGRGSQVLGRLAATALPAALAAPASPIRCAEKDGVLVADWDGAAYPHLMASHVGERRTTLGLWSSGGTARFLTGVLPAGGRFELCLSRGLETYRLTVARERP